MSYESLDAQVQELATYAINFSDEHYNTTEKTIVGLSPRVESLFVGAP